MKNDKWVERWVVPSSRGGRHIVGRDASGNWGCSCIGWTMRVKRHCPDCGSELGKFDKVSDDLYRCYNRSCRKTVTPIKSRTDCKHIVEVKGGGGKSVSDATLDILAGR